MPAAKPQKKTTRDLEFLFEMGNIRLIDRMWRRFHATSFANLADHHFRVFWIAMIIAGHEGNVDTSKIAKMALLHDIAESRTGDVDYLARQYVERNEELAISDMLKETILEDEYKLLIEEYEARDSLEAKIVKDADNLDVDLELAEQEAQGSQLRKQWKDMRQMVGATKLYTKTAKRLHKQIMTADPHVWHQKARNRQNSGDWRK